MKGEQLKIPVPAAPEAIGRWDREHETAAYRAAMGESALARQQRLAELAKECTCGKQTEADAAAVKDDRRSKRLLGWEHKPGCNSYSRRNPKLARMSDDEQITRYEEARRDEGGES